MVSIPLPNPESPDIFSYGFEKDLSRGIPQEKNPLVYNPLEDTVQSGVQKFGVLSVSTTQNLFQIDPSKGVFLANSVVRTSTCFEATGRFASTAVGSGAATFGTDGLVLDSSATMNGSASSTWFLSTGGIFAGNPTFTMMIEAVTLQAASESGSSFFGLGVPTVSGTGHIYTVNHIGFKAIKSGGTINLYATQADGTTELVSSSLTTLADDDTLDLVLRVNGRSSVSYWWKKNNGALSNEIKLASNIPTGTVTRAQFSVSNDNTAATTKFRCLSASYER